MEKYTSIFCTLKATIFLLLLAIAITCPSSARILDEDLPPEAPITAPDLSNPVVPPVTDTTAPPVVVSVAPTQPHVSGATTTSTATVANGEPHHPLTFFMHDVLAGSHPSARVVTGIITTSSVNSQLPFAKNDGGVLPINGGIPLLNGNNGIINNNNNIPFLTGLGGQTTTSINGNNVNSGNTLPFVMAGLVPVGSTLQKLMFGTITVIDDELTEGHELVSAMIGKAQGFYVASSEDGTLQKLMFGTITVIDDELTEGHELGSAVIGKAQGFYVASSEDGTSQTMAFTALFGDDHYTDSLSFFGVHRIVSAESQVAIVGGTGKYANAKGYAAIQTLHPVDQHTTDGVETLLQFTVYLSY